MRIAELARGRERAPERAAAGGLAAVTILDDFTGEEFLGVGLLAIIGVQELLWKARTIGNQHFKMLETLLLAAAMYWILTSIFSVFQERLEQRMARGDR